MKMADEQIIKGKVERIEEGIARTGANFKKYIIDGQKYGQFKNINELIKVGDFVLGKFFETDEGYRNIIILSPVSQDKTEFKSAETIPQRKDDYPCDDYARGAVFGMMINQTFEEMRDQGKSFSDTSDAATAFNAIFDKIKKVVLEKRKKELEE